MRVLIVSTCRYRLSEYEFVTPLIQICRKSGAEVEVARYDSLRNVDPGRYSHAVISGTALKDFDYLNYVEDFEPLLEEGIPVLGICAGAQVIALYYGSKLEDLVIIGRHPIHVVRENPLLPSGTTHAYFLLSKVIVPTRKLIELGRTGEATSLYKVEGRETYGALFHPEVLNREVIRNFLENT